jgi:hypothetical protein
MSKKPTTRYGYTAFYTKLIIFKIPTYLLFTIKAFLEGRSFTVHLNEALSSPKSPLRAFRKEQSGQPHSSHSIFLIYHTTPTLN